MKSTLREYSSPQSLPNGAAYLGPFQRSPVVGTINHHHARDA